MSLEDQVTQLYLDAREDVYRYLLTLGLQPAQAQENTQEAFLRLHQASRSREAIRNPRAWIFRVAHNLAMTQRTRESRNVAAEPDWLAQQPDQRKGAESKLIDKEKMTRLRAALAGLSPQQRQCLHLRAEGLRYHEIAEVAGIGISTVGEFLSRAMRRLRQAVND
jgi:RNA polymerase sigma-70 factor (ECF subfamily)